MSTPDATEQWIQHHLFNRHWIANYYWYLRQCLDESRAPLDLRPWLASKLEWALVEFRDYEVRPWVALDGKGNVVSVLGAYDPFAEQGDVMIESCPDIYGADSPHIAGYGLYGSFREEGQDCIGDYNTKEAAEQAASNSHEQNCNSITPYDDGRILHHCSGPRLRLCRRMPVRREVSHDKQSAEYP